MKFDVVFFNDLNMSKKEYLQILEDAKKNSDKVITLLREEKKVKKQERKTN